MAKPSNIQWVLRDEDTGLYAENGLMDSTTTLNYAHLFRTRYQARVDRAYGERAVKVRVTVEEV